MSTGETDTAVDRLSGRELDAAVAEEVMGWRYVGWAVRQWTSPEGEKLSEWDVPHYSTDISAAWEVVEKVADMGLFPALRWLGKGWRFHVDAGGNRWENGRTAPEAICRAVLAAVRAGGLTGTEDG